MAEDNLAKPQSFNSMPVEQISPAFRRQFVYDKEALLARIEVLKGCQVPHHQHPSEQITVVLQGAMRMLLGEQECIIRAGEVVVIPGGLPHSGEALEDTMGFDVFAPPRTDWIQGENTYLTEANVGSFAPPAGK